MAFHQEQLRMPALLMALLLVRSAMAAPFQDASQSAGASLTISILDGDNAIMNVRQRVNREAIVEVDDENHKPVAGALVTFFAPQDGPSAVFVNGAQSTTVVTDAQGHATLAGIRPNALQGKYEIRVQASKNGQTANAVIHITNALPPGAATASSAGLSSKGLIAILAAAAAAGIGVGLAVSLGGGGSKSPSSIILQPGAPSIAGPGH